jgi:hypothetical protein
MGRQFVGLTRSAYGMVLQISVDQRNAKKAGVIAGLIQAV